MRVLLFLAVFFALVHVHGQKLVRKAFIGPRTETIQIDSQYCYKIDLQTSTSNEVEVSASIEGEYAKDLLISIEEKGTTVVVSADFQPLFINPNDKLSAHKVVSIALQILVPEYKNVAVYGTNANVYSTGKYENLNITLSDGRCTLEDISESVTVTTQKGDIILAVPKGEIVAESIYGEVNRESIPLGDNVFVLKTIEGNIFLTKTK
ncbi:MAG: hypothetical protein GYB37_13920 [Algicola sp.]|nr:hypothetical protein [Algicola sp.]